MTGSQASPLMRWRDVADLTSASGYPCISLLLPTTPAPQMSEDDNGHLRELASSVEADLQDVDLPTRSKLLRLLDDLVEDVSAQPTTASVGLYVSLDVQRVLHLPNTVAPRAVVESSFATRDVVRALHRTPPHLLLILHSTCAQIYRVQGRAMERLAMVELQTPGQAATAAWTSLSGDAVTDFLGDVDDTLAAQRREHPSPLVLAGSPAMVKTLRRSSDNLGRLAAVLNPRQCETPEALLRYASEGLEEYLRGRQQDALTRLRRARQEKPQLVTTGLEAAWKRAGRDQPVVLAVEDGYAMSGHHPAAGSAQPEEDDGPVHDLVDDLIELVINRGGWVALVDDGTLSDLGRVALLSHAGAGQ